MRRGMGGGEGKSMTIFFFLESGGWDRNLKMRRDGKGEERRGEERKGEMKGEAKARERRRRRGKVSQRFSI